MVDVDFVAILLAAAALVVSLASLYTTALRGGEVWIDVLPHPEGNELGRGGASNDVPSDDRLHLLILVSNTGAHGAVLEDVRFTRFEYRGTAPRLWVGLGQTSLQTGPHWSPYNAQETDLPLAASLIVEVADRMLAEVAGPARDRHVDPWTRRRWTEAAQGLVLPKERAQVVDQRTSFIPE